MNMVEIWFGILTNQTIRRGSFESVARVVGAIKAFLDRWNEGAKPFVWTKTAEQILTKAVRWLNLFTRLDTSCSLFLKRDYPLWMMGSDVAKQVLQNVYHFSEYLLLLHMRGELNTDFRPLPQTVFYHTPFYKKAELC